VLPTNAPVTLVVSCNKKGASMSDWWYSEKSKKIGPVRVEELSKLFQSGKIDPR